MFYILKNQNEYHLLLICIYLTGLKYGWFMASFGIILYVFNNILTWSYISNLSNKSMASAEQYCLF